MHKAYGTFIFLNLFDCFWRTKCKILKQYLPSILVFWLSCCRLLVGKKKNTWEIDLFCTLGIDQRSYPCRFVTGDLDTRSQFQNFIFSMYSVSLHNKDIQSLNSPRRIVQCLSKKLGLLCVQWRAIQTALLPVYDSVFDVP